MQTFFLILEMFLIFHGIRHGWLIIFSNLLLFCRLVWIVYSQFESNNYKIIVFLFFEVLLCFNIEFTCKRHIFVSTYLRKKNLMWKKTNIVRAAVIIHRMLVQWTCKWHSQRLMPFRSVLASYNYSANFCRRDLTIVPTSFFFSQQLHGQLLVFTINRYISFCSLDIYCTV